ncbi:CBS domain-containing protein [Herbaspirillum seropedicae]|uniref:Chloride channel EriC protein n=1 Tax=Herbaspirillum seropedicae (strain SmR1) TaxID=757424 RepID=D8IQ51_HERSS|nr:chloride channel protein [Herbaspirillum seropedicae]ADJ63097.1 chloride channel EriC protein [Herbaspirillum seropedicae SmR1]AKN65168.1 chloride channel protein [Herbaspirillum seropedicae]NQE32149.1 chloride channel protein [Herbaspirillum seropedicae]UMU21121.1 CBS domain-containing protein [Herbaspirillum seropedicae]
MKHKRDYTADRRLPYLCAIALPIGLLSTGAAWLLLKLIALFTNLFYFQRLSLAASTPATHTLGWIAALLPIAGGLIVGLMARYGSDKIRGHGIPEAIEAILFGKSRMSPKVALLKPLSSGIVIGSGGPFGAEGPIIMTGGSIGSLLAQLLHLTAAERKTLLVAGACAGMTAIFGTPLAAVLLAVELLLFELKPRSLLPVALACAVAGFVRPWLVEAGPLFPLDVAAPTPVALLSCLVAGLASGVLAAALTLALYRIEDGFHRLRLHWMWWPALGGIAVGLGGLLQPRALGVGYDVIGDLLHQHMLLSAALALLLVKAVIWLLALGSGTSGGVLAPLLMLGAGLGLVLSPWLPGGSDGLWPLVCMAGVLGSVLGAPLTAIVFAFGLTHASQALLPLIATTAVAYGVNVLLMKRSIMTEKIARRGLHVHREYGVDPLERMHVEELMTAAPQTLAGALPAAEALAWCRAQEHVHRYYPVTDGVHLVGMLALRALEHADASQPCDTLAQGHEHYLLPHMSARSAAGMMARLGVARLPVVAGPERRKLVGVLSLSDLARASAAHAEEESVRERLLGG